MMRYKRNQVEEAIVRTLGAKDAHVDGSEAENEAASGD